MNAESRLSGGRVVKEGFSRFPHQWGNWEKLQGETSEGEGILKNFII